MEQFRALMFLIVDLRDDAMRPRHWEELRIEVKEDFNEKDDDFTLEKVRSLNLTSSSATDKIAELADNARKELKIEL